MDSRRTTRTVSRLTTVGVVAATALVGSAVGALSATGSADGASGTGSAACRPTVTTHPFGRAYDLYAGKRLPVKRYTLRSCHGMRVRILSYGGIIQSIDVPGRHGHRADVVLGFKTLKEYAAEASPPPPATGGPYFGESIGRYGNRIAKGTFTLGGKTYTLPINNGPNTLHGGFVGFGNHVWSAHTVRTKHRAGVRLRIVSPNGDDGSNVGCSCTGFPGRLTETVTYTVDRHNRLHLRYQAHVRGHATVFNPTNHSYFNLAGEASGTAYAQKVMINANRYTPTDKTQIPTGRLATVAGTPFDFRRPHTIGSRINRDNKQLLIAQGYDHNWVLRKTGPRYDGLRLAARASDPRSGRRLTVWTDQPGVQFYSGNFLDGTLVGISDHIYRQGDGYTFETQHFPDSPNQPSFPSTVLRPGQHYDSRTVFAFSR